MATNSNTAGFPRTVKRSLVYLVLALLGTIAFFPLLWMFYSSFKSNQEIVMNTMALPTALHFENYRDAWSVAKIGVYFGNSLFVSTVSVLLIILFGTMASFILAKFRFLGQKAVYNYFIVGMLIPMQTVLVPLFIVMKNMGLLNSYWSLILSYTGAGLPLAIFVLESFIRAFPDSVIEAAVIDGSTMGRVFTQMVVPMSVPAISTIGILSFLNNWKEFSFALVFISDESKKTLPLGLYNFLGEYTNNYAQLFAALVIASLPIIVMYLCLQKQIVNGMTAGAVKG